MTAIGTMTLQPLAPSGTPDARDMALLGDLITRVTDEIEEHQKRGKESITPELSAQQTDAEAKLTSLLARILNQVVAIPDAPPLGVHLRPLVYAANIRPSHRMIEVNQVLGGKVFSAAGATQSLALWKETIPYVIATIAVQYRQALCQEMLLAVIKEARTRGRPINRLDGYGEVPSYTDPKTFALRHPAALLTDYQRTSLDFAQDYRPEANAGYPRLAWLEDYPPTTNGREAEIFSLPGKPYIGTGRHYAPTWLTLKLRSPESVIASLPGQRLAKVIEIEPAILAKLSPHAVRAWNEVTLGPVLSYQDRTLKIAVEPARQVSWIPGIMPPHIERAMADWNSPNTPMPDSSRIDRALINLARSAETV